MNYQNKQLGTAFLVFIAGLISFIGLMAITEERGTIILPVIAILAVIALLFSTLNITVNDSCIKWSFGPSFWKKSISLSNIRSVKVIKTQWYYGLGIRLIPTGWFYTVSGLQAVELSLNDGSIVSLGSNEPNKLASAIKEQLTKNSAP